MRLGGWLCIPHHNTLFMKVWWVFSILSLSFLICMLGLFSSFWGIPPSECCVAVQGHGGLQTQRLLSTFFGGGNKAIRP